MTDIIVEPKLNPDDIKKLKQREQKRDWARRNRTKLMEYKTEWVKNNLDKHNAYGRPHKAAYARRKRVEKLYLQELQWFLYKEFDVELDIDPLI
jgi:hypothetical protein